MNIDSSIVANFFLKKAKKERIPVSSMKLIKLVYISYGWCLATLNQDILNGEQIEVWQYDPVIPSIYHEFKRFGNQPLETFSETLLEESKSSFQTKPVFIEDKVITEDPQMKNKIITVLQTVWDSYKEYSAWGLSEKIHEQKSPWSECNKQGKKIIEKEEIKKYYENFLTKALA